GAHLLVLNLTPQARAGELRFRHQIAVSPMHARDRYFESNGLGTGVTIAEDSSRSLKIEDADAAYRLVANGAGWNGSVSVFRGREHMPHYVLSTDAGNPVLVREFEKHTAAGADLSFTLGGTVVRAEAAAKFFERVPSFAEGVFGLE